MKHSITYHDVPRETFLGTLDLYQKYKENLTTYIDQLFWWNERINLISRDVSRETVEHHILHSLLLSQFKTFQEAVYIIDSGTGGGLPGLPLAITHPAKSFVLNDIVTKKVLAVRQMAKKNGLSNIDTADYSIAELTPSSPFLLISKHAFKINSLLQLISDKPWEEIVLYKGMPFEEELTGVDAPLNIEVHSLYPQSGNDFYKDKALIFIQR